MAAAKSCVLSLLSRKNLPRVCLSRCVQTSSANFKNLRTAQYKVTIDHSKPLTFEQAQPPYKIGVSKSWNAWNTTNLKDEEIRISETTVEDMFIRKFISGTWHRLFVSEVVIKRRHNMIMLVGLVSQSIAPRKLYFLIGFTEELLSCLFNCPVKLEIRTVKHKNDMIFKYI